MTKHPAPYSPTILQAMQSWLDKLVEPGAWVLDPMAGVGTVHQLTGYATIGVELEPEWANMNPKTRVGDATALDFIDDLFDACAVSPCYGNRMADHHDAKERCRACKDTGDPQCERCDGKGFNTWERNTYRHKLGRELSENNAGGLQWSNGPSGNPYRELHEKAWAEVYRVLKPGAPFLLNCKDHIRQKKRQHVTSWHYKTALALGFNLVAVESIATRHYKYGANRDDRCVEKLLVFRKGKP